MTVDATVQAILDTMPSTPMEQLDPGTMRAGMDSTAMPRNDEGLAGVEDTTIAGVPCRVYRPASRRVTGTIVFFHGGGFVVGSLRSHDALAAALCSGAGAEVVAVDYRLAPEHRFPAAVDDCWAVTQAVDGPIALAGDSAGGNLAAVVALLARDAGRQVAIQALIYPVVDPEGEEQPSRRENATGYLLTTDMMHWFHRHYLASEADKFDWRVAPLHADLVGVAPALVITAQYDPLRDEGELYAQRLQEAGVAVKVHRYDGMIHGFVQWPLPQAAEAVAEVAAAISAALAPG